MLITMKYFSRQSVLIAVKVLRDVLVAVFFNRCKFLLGPWTGFLIYLVGKKNNNNNVTQENCSKTVENKDVNLNLYLLKVEWCQINIIITFSADSFF